MDNVNKLICSLQDFFASDSVKLRLDAAILSQKSFSKWTCYSDYCFSDINKPNDVISFVMLPFESEGIYQEHKDFISSKQSKDLKEVKSVNSDFLSYIKGNGIISFGYILDSFTLWLGIDKEEQRNSLKECLLQYKTQFDRWMDSATDDALKKHYSDLSKQLNDICTKKIKDKEINTYIEMLLVAVIGAVSLSEIAKRLDKVEILGWFSDRDAILDKGNGLICNLMHATLYCLLQNPDFQFATYNLDSSNKPFFDEFNRISDIITGTLADYNVESNTVSKNKFSKVLREYLADNSSAFVHRLAFASDIKISDIQISLDPHS